ncbi:hypothetical protein ACT3TP_16535 [Glutamicibacter sp. AOP38-B1-38]|uniref:hypothetical protein n=1 Tax=Glutamicibacter sp. AOP38-B1-38 TaxID=3457680 RepID=UPI0040344B58
MNFASYGVPEGKFFYRTNAFVIVAIPRARVRQVFAVNGTGHRPEIVLFMAENRATVGYFTFSQATPIDEVDVWLTVSGESWVLLFFDKKL